MTAPAHAQHWRLSCNSVVRPGPQASPGVADTLDREEADWNDRDRPCAPAGSARHRSGSPSAQAGRTGPLGPAAGVRRRVRGMCRRAGAPTVSCAAAAPAGVHLGSTGDGPLRARTVRPPPRGVAAPSGDLSAPRLYRLDGAVRARRPEPGRRLPLLDRQLHQVGRDVLRNRGVHQGLPRRRATGPRVLRLDRRVYRGGARALPAGREQLASGGSVHLRRQ